VSKKLQQKQERRRAEEARKAAQRRAQRRSNLATIGVAAVVGALVVGGIIYQRSTDEGGVSGNVGVSEAAANCESVESFPAQGAAHIDVGAEHEPYNSTPPTSGPHFEVPANPGFYSEPLPPEQVIHNLEHGFVVIWYRSDAPERTIENIEAITRQELPATVAVPFDDIDRPHQFALTAWVETDEQRGQLQLCERVSQAVIDDFRRRYQGRGPERIAPPFDG
jgi:hypothetical protein